MTGRDDYLWDRSGEPDPLVERLEQALAPLAHDGRPLPLERLPAPRPARRWPFVLAAAALLAVVVGAWLFREPSLAEGDAPRTFAAGKQPVLVRLGDLAQLTLQPGSELHFVHWTKEQALFRLATGALEARVAPPPAVQPGFFRIGTALGTVIDQGCRYQLSLAEGGDAFVRVTEGAVTFEFPARTVFVPAQATTTVGQGGPSTPVFLDAEPELRKAVRFYDELAEKSRAAKDGGDVRREGAKMVVEYARAPRDTLPLWHLLHDDDETIRALAEDALLRLVGPPENVETKEPHWDAAVWLAFLRLSAWQLGR